MKKLFKQVSGVACLTYGKVGSIKDETVYELKNGKNILYILLYKDDITTYAEELDCFIT